jgi:hypothetical protein
MLFVVLGLAGVMQAQNSSKQMELSGTVCQASCVTYTGTPSLPTCDTLCTNTGGDAVLVDDKGNVQKIANQDMCTSHMGKHVKMKAMASEQPAAAATPTEKQREQTLRIMEIHNDPGGGM